MDGSRCGRVVLGVATLLPAVYLLLAIQHGALTHPFWDHVELTFLFDKLHAGTLQFADLLVPHNHSRPLVNRALLLGNGWLTDWDLRSEYVYVYLAIGGAFLLQLRALRRTATGVDAAAGDRLRLPVLALLCSLFCFSPVGHNNHWWSQQFQLDFANVLVVAALIAVALAPQRWSAHLGAAACCWLATWTLSNGFAAFATCALVSQWASGRWRPDVRALFWGANLLVIAALYLPGLAETGSAVRPTPLQVLDFATVYLGAPIGGLLWFPFKSMFDLPRHCDMNRTVGILLWLGTAAAVVAARARIRARGPGTLLFVAFAAFAVLSALMTAWGRATFDAYGIANANGSRFTIFAAHLPFALLCLLAGGGATAPWLRWPAAIGATMFVAAAVVSYGRGVVVYRDAHRFDRELALVYATGDDAELTKLHPNLEHARAVRRILVERHLGPFRSASPVASAALQTLAGGKAVDDFGLSGLRLDAERGRHLFAHPHSVFLLPLPAGRYHVRCRYGVYREAAALQPPSDGVEFRVHAGKAAGSPLAWQATVAAAAVADGEREADFEVELAGDDNLVFETLAGATVANDWAYWRDLVVEPLRAR